MKNSRGPSWHSLLALTCLRPQAIPIVSRSRITISNSRAIISIIPSFRPNGGTTREIFEQRKAGASALN